MLNHAIDILIICISNENKAINCKVSFYGSHNCGHLLLKELGQDREFSRRNDRKASGIVTTTWPIGYYYFSERKVKKTWNSWLSDFRFLNKYACWSKGTLDLSIVISVFASRHSMFYRLVPSTSESDPVLAVLLLAVIKKMWSKNRQPFWWPIWPLAWNGLQ